jgi:hypothetical protein
MTMQKTRVTVVAWIAVTVAVAIVAYLIGHHRGPSATATVSGPGVVGLSSGGGGIAWIGAGLTPKTAGGLRSASGLAYRVPADVEWSDSSGNTHIGSSPPCLRVGESVRVKQIGAVRFTVHGTTAGTVLWIQC